MCHRTNKSCKVSTFLEYIYNARATEYTRRLQYVKTHRKDWRKKTFSNNETSKNSTPSKIETYELIELFLIYTEIFLKQVQKIVSTKNPPLRKRLKNCAPIRWDTLSRFPDWVKIYFHTFSTVYELSCKQRQSRVTFFSSTHHKT